MKSVMQLFHFAREMGLRYTVFRLWFELQRKSGILKLRFQRNAVCRHSFSLVEWKRTVIEVRWTDFLLKEPHCTAELSDRVNRITAGNFPYFDHTWYNIQDWHTNPIRGFRYDPDQHWSDIPDFSEKAGDIKYVWEKSRFLFLADLIRHDLLTGNDHAALTFRLIESWIDHNPVNCGPNWKCGQEIALRVMHWTIALHFYRDSEHLTETLFRKIASSIYLQIQRVEINLAFSLIAVRNNHALTECLGLYVTGVLLPFFPESKRWREKGKQLFEREIEYQIREDGTYIQHSMNYHRVVVQLLTLAMFVGKVVDENWSPVMHDRARKSLDFLCACQDQTSGWLPNYGPNDGALFFRNSDAHFRDYLPQLAALSDILAYPLAPPVHGVKSFHSGGYYVIREGNTLTILRCTRYDSRPFQADNLHIDIWVNGENILRDAGTFSYLPEESSYFESTQAHNTVTIAGADQMQKGPRFTWTNWIREAECELFEAENAWVFQGWFEGFKHLGPGIRHHRRVQKIKGRLCWIVEDRIQQAPAKLPIRQHWHLSPGFEKKFALAGFDHNNSDIPPERRTGYYSESYGKKSACDSIVFSTERNYILTTINAIPS